MATAKNAYGTKSITVGELAPDGGMGTTLTELFGQTVTGSVVFSVEKVTKEGVPIEESTNPIGFLQTSQPSFTLTGSTYNANAIVMQLFFGGVVTGVAGIATKGTITGGSGYVNGTYTDVPLTGGTGQGARATIVVAGGAVTTVTITSPGLGYTVADSLTASSKKLGGAGTGFSTPVATLSNTAESWSAPVGGSRPSVQLSVIVETISGIKFKFVRMEFNPSLSMTLSKDKYGQIDWEALVVEPDKANTPAYTIEYP